MDAIPFVALEFFRIKAPVVVPVVNKKSPSVALEIVSSFANVIIPPDISNPPVPATTAPPATVVVDDAGVELPIMVKYVSS